MDAFQQGEGSSETNLQLRDDAVGRNHDHVEDLATGAGTAVGRSQHRSDAIVDQGHPGALSGGIREGPVRTVPTGTGENVREFESSDAVGVVDHDHDRTLVGSSRECNIHHGHGTGGVDLVLVGGDVEGDRVAVVGHSAFGLVGRPVAVARRWDRRLSGCDLRGRRGRGRRGRRRGGRGGRGRRGRGR